MAPHSSCDGSAKRRRISLRERLDYGTIAATDRSAIPEETMPDLLKSVEDGVMKLTFNRPEAMNALSRDMMVAFTDSLEEAAGSRDIGCVVVRGAGEKAFCAGGDVKSMAAGRDQEKTYEDKVHDIRVRMRVSELLHEMGKPTIAMVNGVAAGAGLSIALAADMRFAGKSARMTTAFAKVGFSGDFGSHYFLHKLVGTAKARELYFTAEILNAEQIEKLGLANRVVEDDKLDAETMAFARKLAAGPRVAWWHVKKNMKVAEEGSLSEALDSEAARMIRTGETNDHKEAARAFVEKRAPVFKGN
jgi:2-(1,2-epoxy-1,2-dihydrophenyl)acetyl-CoA isomerase